MNNPLRSPEDYELFLYTLSEQFPVVRHSTLTFVRIGMSLARVAGEITFSRNMRLVVRERIIYDRLPCIIDGYGYEIWRGDQKLCWYDSQPHPNDQSLQSTHPHHKHISPNIKHNRITAPEMSFDHANLTVLIHEIEDLIR